MCWGGCRDAAAVTADPLLADGQFWQSPSRGTCPTGALLGGGGGMPLLVVISIVSAMVARVFWGGSEVWFA
jgi:hypothetical protein